MIKLRKLEEKDLQTRVDWMNNPKIYETMHFTLPITIEKTQEWFQNNRGNNSRIDLVVEENDFVLAMDGLTGIDDVICKGESYTMVNPEHKSKGIGTKTLFLKSIYAFEIAGVKKIWAYIDGDNIASIKMCERIGYKIEGVLRNEILRDGVLIDRMYMGCLEEDLKKELFNYRIENDEIFLFED
jgi:RimJ/RimL family protein N-acetyltransferase